MIDSLSDLGLKTKQIWSTGKNIWGDFYDLMGWPDTSYERCINWFQPESIYRQQMVSKKLSSPPTKY